MKLIVSIILVLLSANALAMDSHNHTLPKDVIRIIVKLSTESVDWTLDEHVLALKNTSLTCKSWKAAIDQLQPGQKQMLLDRIKARKIFNPHDGIIDEAARWG